MSIKHELLARALSVEEMLLTLWKSYFPATKMIALVAVGGFGRAALFPKSDVDLLILHQASQTGPASRFDEPIKAFLAECWTLKLDIACSVHTPASAEQLALDDLSFMTSLLDHRLLAGKASLLKSLLERLRPEHVYNSVDFFAAKVAEQRTRHERFADTAYNIEPNIKDGPGGLRDLHTIRWVLQRLFNERHWADFQEQGFINAQERTRLEFVESELSLYRFALHEQSQRKEERLLLDYQIKIAESFGYKDLAPTNRAVEQLMQRYFRAVRETQRLSELLLKRFAELITPYDATAVEIDRGFVQRNGQISEPQDVSQASNRAGISVLRALNALRALQDTPEAEGLGGQLLKQFAELVSAIEAQTQVAQETEFADTLISIFEAPQRVALTLTHAARTGLLGALLPAFAKVTGRMQYDLFHAYTVDQHTLFVLEKLEFLRSPQAAELHPLAHEVWSKIRRPELLFFAALFHDIAKGRGGDHSELGSEEARTFLAALGFPNADVERVAWLVEQHLTMSTTAQKRDIQDPGVVRQFALLVSERERLDELYLLTCADIMGTNPKLWNGWKAKLLSDLYTATRVALRRGLENPVHAAERLEAARSAALELLRGEGAGRTQVLNMWATFPERVFLRHTPDEIRFQTQSILAHERANDRYVIAIRPIGSTGSFELFVRVPDRFGIFAMITSTLDRVGMGVVGARIASNAHAQTHDSFQLLDAQPPAGQSPRARALDVQMQLRVSLLQADYKTRAAKRAATRQQKHFQFSPQIEISDVESSATHDETSVEHGLQTLSLICPDTYGLLARVAIVLFEQKVRVHTARIATFGERVEDFFQISEIDSKRLNPTRCAQLVAALHEALRS